MDLADVGEFGFIRRINSLVTHQGPAIVTGIGDDAAVLAPPAGCEVLLSTDAMVEGRHFRRDWMSQRQIGARAAAAALSDIAAMGGQAQAILCTLCIDPHIRIEEAEDLFIGMQALAERFGAGLAGGDIVAARGPMILDIVAVGTARTSCTWRRSGAREGDRLLLTGCLGDAAAAVDLLASDDAISIDCFPNLLRALAEPIPRLDVARLLAANSAIHAAIDTSDGLLQDSGHIAEASGVGLQINAADVPVSRELLDCARLLRRDPLGWAVSGGEDFELLLAVEASAVEDIAGLLLEEGIRAAEIGAVVGGEGVALLDQDGDRLSPPARGWDHFSAEID